MFIKKISCYSFLFLCLHVYKTASSDDLMKQFVEALMECNKDYPMSADDVKQLNNKQLPDTENMRCLFACAYKATGMMDDKGMLSVDHVNNQAKEYYKDDDKKLAKAREFTDACKKVNDIEVSDGSRGCDRAALIFKCSVDEASKYGFGADEY